MFSSLLSIDNAIRTFFNQLTDTIGFAGYLGIFLAVEVLFIIIFGIRASMSYEARLKRSLDRANQWLFKHKVIDSKKIKAFNEVMKKSPKRLTYFWQQYILYREGAPSTYMTIDNVIEKPLKSSGWLSSVKNLGIVTVIWSAIALIFGLASQTTNPWSYLYVAVSLVLPCAVLLIGAIAIIIIKSMRTVNLDDLYHIYHLFARFVDNACAELPPYIDFDLLFTAKEIENGNPQLREYYEARARKAKEEFENAKKNDTTFVVYNFENVGVDGGLLLNRAMKESETYINKKTSALGKIAQAESQKEALRRNYENVQMDLQRKIQASKENIQKLIEQQASTTSRIEIGLLRQQQEKESKKQEALQKDYDQEEARYKSAKADLDAEIESVSKILVESLEDAEKGMSSEYQSFYEKVMKSAYAVAEKKAEDEKKELKKLNEKTEKELINIQTQNKHLLDENLILREKLEKKMAENAVQPEQAQPVAQIQPETKIEEPTEIKTEEPVVEENNAEGHYDEEGNFIYADGSYYSADGYFHDVDGKVYDMSGVEVTGVTTDESASEEALVNAQIDQFGSFVPTEQENAGALESNPEEIQDQENKSVDEEENQQKEEVGDDAEEPSQKRGRPRKLVNEEVLADQPKKPRGRPRKETSEEAKDENSPAKKRGRPKGTVKTKKIESTQPRKPGRPRKSPILGEDIDSLSKISQLISEEEAKLNKMKDLLNSEIDEVMKAEEQEQVDKEREELINEVEALKAKAAGVDKSSNSNEELASINKRLEDLIKEISVLNNKQN